MRCSILLCTVLLAGCASGSREYLEQAGEYESGEVLLSNIRYAASEYGTHRLLLTAVNKSTTEYYVGNVSFSLYDSAGQVIGNVGCGVPAMQQGETASITCPVSTRFTRVRLLGSYFYKVGTYDLPIQARIADE